MVTGTFKLYNNGTQKGAGAVLAWTNLKRTGVKRRLKLWVKWSVLYFYAA